MMDLKTMRHSLLLLAGLLTTVGFKPEPAHVQANVYVFVAIAQVQKPCDTSSFGDIIGHKAVTYTKGAQTFDEVLKKLKADAQQAYPNATITTQTGLGTATILSYQEKLVGWKCTVQRFVVGFGPTCQSSKEAALNLRNDTGKSAPYQLVEQVNCH